MSTARTAICALVVVVLAVVAVAQSQGVAPANLASPWVELHAARVRLLAGAPAVKSAKSYLAGVEITLAEGWKTYWRTPGDAGVPPLFDWTGSTNVAAIKVRYPAPHRMQEPGAETIGYKSAVIFPVEVVPSDPSKPVGLKLTAGIRRLPGHLHSRRGEIVPHSPSLAARGRCLRRRSSPRWSGCRARRRAVVPAIPRCDA